MPADDAVPSSEQIAAAARLEAFEEAAKIADTYAEVNIEAAGDTILLDPVFSGESRSAAAFAKSKDLMIEGCIHSSMYHAAKNIAEAIRERASTPTEGEEPSRG